MIVIAAAARGRLLPLGRTNARGLGVMAIDWMARELVLDKYLTEIDQGWIYRRARSYHVARQAEDEEKAGRKLLTEMLGDGEWAGRNYFLVNQLVAAVPHGIPDSAVLKSRNLAASIAARDAKFQTLRAKIHSQPGPEDVQSVEAYITEKKSGDEQLKELLELLRQQYSATPAAHLASFQKKRCGLPPSSGTRIIAELYRRANDNDTCPVPRSTGGGRRNTESHCWPSRDFNLLQCAAGKKNRERGCQATRKDSSHHRSRVASGW